jgi:hypothetical protein
MKQVAPTAPSPLLSLAVQLQVMGNQTKILSFAALLAASSLECPNFSLASVIVMQSGT